MFDDEHVRVWDLLDEVWTATIKNGSGGMGKIAHAEFGRTKDEVLVLSDCLWLGNLLAFCRRLLHL